MIGTMVQQDLALEMELHDTKDMILCTSSNFLSMMSCIDNGSVKYQRILHPYGLF